MLKFQELRFRQGDPMTHLDTVAEIIKQNINRLSKSVFLQLQSGRGGSEELWSASKTKVLRRCCHQKSV
jgi:hypothetical protein